MCARRVRLLTEPHILHAAVGGWALPLSPHYSPSSPLNLGLHPPVSELDLAELVGAHDALAAGRGLRRAVADLGPVGGGERGGGRQILFGPNVIWIK